MKNEYIKIHKKRLLHIAVCILICTLITIAFGFIAHFLPDSMKNGGAIVSMFFIQVGIWIAEYRKWVDEKYPEEKE